MHNYYKDKEKKKLNNNPIVTKMSETGLQNR